MTDSSRPPAFRLPSPKPRALFLFFGKGDYVIAASASEASCLWMDHFNDLCYAREFEQLPDDEEILLYIDCNEASCDLWVMTKEDLREIEGGAEYSSHPAREVIERFGPGYLASTTED